MASKNYNINSNLYVNEGKIVGGYNNVVSSGNTSILGGYNNTNNEYAGSTIVAGSYNTISSQGGWHIIGAGNANVISGDSGNNWGSFIGSGRLNKIYGNRYSSIVSGERNVIGSEYTNNFQASTIVGGQLNTLDGGYSFIGGGKSNSLDGDYSFIGGGRLNYLNNSTYSSVLNGERNVLTGGTHSVIGGGENNEIKDNSGNGWSVIAGGFGNNILSTTGGRWVNVIAGGGSNIIYNSKYSSIVGGTSNYVNSDYSFIGGGIDSVISSNGGNNTVGGGFGHNIGGTSSLMFIGGGSNNTITGSIQHSSILGGLLNTVNHNNSHIIGSNITSISANTTHVERLNIKTVDTGSTATDVFVRESNGMVNTSPISSLLSAAGVVEQLNDLNDVTIDILPYSATTQADDGKLMFYEKDTEQWITNDTVTHGTSVINGKKSTAGTLQIGTPVYLIGFDSDLHTVEAANATTATTMPCIGLVAETMDNVNSKHIMTFGKLQGVDTTTGSTINPNNETWNINDDLYVSTTTGGLTKFRPTGAATQIQRIAKVLKVSNNDGQLLVFNTARTAGLPNLTEDHVWVGDSNNQPVETPISNFTQQKYAANIPFTAATSQTVTHNLNDTDVIVQLKDSTGTLVIPNVVDNYTNNTVDIEVSSTETFRVIIIG